MALGQDSNPSSPKKPIQKSQLSNAIRLLGLSMQRMGRPKHTNHQPRLFGGISPPGVKMLPFSPRAGYTGVRRAWGTEILALKCCCQRCCRAWRAATKPFLPCLTQGTALLGWQSWGTEGRGEDVLLTSLVPWVWASAPVLPHASQEQRCLQKTVSDAEDFPLLYAHCLQSRVLLCCSLLGLCHRI